jgi:predicted RNase H-like HicB family nuclease
MINMAPATQFANSVTGTLEECEAEMREAIEFHIEDLRLSGEPVPRATSHVAIVTVAA